MKKIIALIGLPGCGKTTLGNKLVQEIDDSFFIDDIKDKDLIGNHSHYETVIIADPWLCSSLNEDKFIEYINNNFPSTNVEMKYWENNLEKCLNNILNRNDGRKISDSWVKQLSDNYNPPRVDFKVK